MTAIDRYRDRQTYIGKLREVGLCRCHAQVGTDLTGETRA